MNWVCTHSQFYIFFLQIISILVKSLRNSSGDNIALLLKQVDVIARFYQDRLIALESPPSSSSSAESLKRKTGSRREKGTGHDNGKEALWEQYDRLQVVAQLAQQVLTGLIKTQENVQPYLGAWHICCVLLYPAGFSE